MSAKLLALVLASASGIAFLPGSVPDSASAAPMTVDAVHSSLVFRIKHMDIAWFYGSFTKIAGEINLQEKDGSVLIEVDADSVDSNNEGRDRHLKSQEFFGVKEFPKITFKSRSVAKKGEDWEVAGDFTMHGVTKPLTVVVKHTGTGEDPRAGTKSGFETQFTIKRSDFGMSYGVDKKALGDEVQVMLSVEAAAKK
jgi:polyisoprenoid-binding protein YceI